jgi:hypothetical protein
MKIRVFTLVLLSLLSFSAFATHFMAGYISYEKTNKAPNEYKITVTTFTDSKSPAAHRDEIRLDLGYSEFGRDNKVVTLNSIKDESQILVRDFVWQNKYTITHQFPDSNQSYTLKHVDPNLSNGYLNLNDGQSVNVPAEISTILKTNKNQSSPMFDSVLVKSIGVKSFLNFNGGVFDNENDWVKFELTPENEIYKLPSNIGSTNQVFKVNGKNLIWNKPERTGLYLAKVKVIEYEGKTNIINSTSIAYITFIVEKGSVNSVEEIQKSYLTASNKELVYNGEGKNNQLVVYNLCGQVVVNKTNLNPAQTIDLPNQPGVYIIQFKEGKHEQTFKVSVH